MSNAWTETIFARTDVDAEDLPFDSVAWLTRQCGIEDNPDWQTAHAVYPRTPARGVVRFFTARVLRDDTPVAHYWRPHSAFTDPRPRDVTITDDARRVVTSIENDRVHYWRYGASTDEPIHTTCTRAQWTRLHRD